MHSTPTTCQAGVPGEDTKVSKRVPDPKKLTGTSGKRQIVMIIAKIQCVLNTPGTLLSTL